MPLDAARAVTKTQAITDAFAEIGTVSRTAMPRCTLKAAALARALAAWKLHIAGQLRRLAESAWQQALAGAIKTGTIPDAAKAPEPVGTDRIVYAGPVVCIRLVVAKPIEVVDHLAYVAELLEAGVNPALLRKLAKRHTTETRPAHRFSTSLATT
jgi:hypothetical protein